MAVQLRPGNSTQLDVGYNFTMEEVHQIYRLYNDDNWTLWKLKQVIFKDVQIEEIACAICHAKMDIEQLPYDQRPRSSYDPSSIDLTKFRVGNPSQ